jgi:hypothetical protein
MSNFVHLHKPDTDRFRMASDIARVLPECAVCLEDRQLFGDEAQCLKLLLNEPWHIQKN